MKILLNYTLVLGLGLVYLKGAPAQAHHSFAMFDEKNPQTLTGTVAAFHWTNPHTFVDLAVTNEAGETTLWSLEHGPKNMLSRRGWNSETLKAGDVITVEIHPLRSGKPGGRFMSYSVANSASVEVTSASSSTIFDLSVPDPVEMTPEVARNLNGMWVNANGGIHFDTTVALNEQKPPLRPEYMAKWEQRRADTAAGKSTNDPTALCIPPGFPRFLGMVYPGEILQTDHQINWYAEWYEATVRIYLDGRPQPEPLDSSYNGYTTGTWNGNTLETKTIALRGDTLIDTSGVTHSDQLEVSMSIRKLTPDFLEVDVTLVDPIAFYEPWKTTKHYARAPAEYSIQEYSCQEGNRYEVTEDGSVQIRFEDD